MGRKIKGKKNEIKVVKHNKSLKASATPNDMLKGTMIIVVDEDPDKITTVSQFVPAEDLERLEVDEKGQILAIEAKGNKTYQTIIAETPKLPRNRSLFFPAKSKKYEKIVSIETPEKARKSAKTLLREFKKAKTRSKKVRVKRVTITAMQRAKAQLKRKDLTPKEVTEFKKIVNIYKDAVKEMNLK